MKNLWQKTLNFLGMGEEIEYEEDEENIQITEKKSPLVGLATTKVTDIVVVEPTVYDDAQQIADCLKLRQSVVVNFQNVDFELAKRIVDFTSGVIYAIDGHLQKIKDDIFIFTPKTTNIISRKKEAREGNFLLWGNK